MRVTTSCTQIMRDKSHQTVAMHETKNKIDAINITKQLRHQNNTDPTNAHNICDAKTKQTQNMYPNGCDNKTKQPQQQ